MTSKRLFEPEIHETNTELHQRLAKAIYDLGGVSDDESSWLIQVLPQNEEAWCEFEGLNNHCLMTIRVLADLSTQFTDGFYNQDLSPLAAVFRKFLLHQLRVRSKVILALSQLAETMDEYEIDHTLWDQSRAVSRLVDGFGQLQGLGLNTLNCDETCSPFHSCERQHLV